MAVSPAMNPSSPAGDVFMAINSAAASRPAGHGLRGFGERDDSRVEQSQLFSQGVELGLLAEDFLAQLLEVVLQMRQQQFDVGQAVVSSHRRQSVREMMFDSFNKTRVLLRSPQRGEGTCEAAS